MKIRIKGNSIRLRLTKSEVEEFGREGAYKEQTHFPGGESFGYTLELAAVSHPQAVFQQQALRILLPKEQGLNWCRSEQVGISHSIELTEGKELQILVEKDFACLQPREGEEEGDHFENPNSLPQ